MKDLSAVERYARALFELARESGVESAVEEEIVNFASALKGAPNVEKYFVNPQIRAEEKRARLEKLYAPTGGAHTAALVNFFSVLLEKRRFYLIHEIVEAFRRVARETRGESLAEVRSAVPLDAERETALRTRLERMVGGRVRLKTAVDPALIGGIEIHINNKVLDGSVRHRLKVLQESLLSRRSL